MNNCIQSMTFAWLLVLCLSSAVAQERSFSALTEVPLKSLEGNTVTLTRFKNRPIILEFFNPDCPFVKRAHTRDSFKALIEEAKRKGAVWLAINANAAGRQGTGLERNRRAHKELSLAALRRVAMCGYGGCGRRHLPSFNPNHLIFSTSRIPKRCSKTVSDHGPV